MKQIAKTLLLVFLGLAASVQARENIGQHRLSDPGQGHKIYAGCTPSKASAELYINNVRTPIYINGDMWWDLVGTAMYEVPVNSGKHSLFAGAIWVGGKDAQGNLKVAAQTYRQSGSDFWPGPVDTTNATISNDVCQKYDKHWKISLAEVKDFVTYYRDNGGNLSGYPVPESIKTWPGTGDSLLNQGKYLAPYVDNDGDGSYDYLAGDYPKYNLSSVAQCGEYLLGDQTIWWVFNDVGNIHSETGSQYNIGLEIQAQAFGFHTNDEVNNMTFYKYKIINRAPSTLYNTYFGSWVDADLGNAFDDYVGCDVKRGFGYCYNGDADDDGASGYGINPPAIGMDFFEGPLADPGDGVDNNRDGVVDEPGEQIIMSKFVYYNNDFSNIGNPSTAQHYYNYLMGVWKDGSKLVYGGTGYQTAGADTCDFMFPGDTDPTGWGTNGVPLSQLFPWSENYPKPGDPPNTPDDRRFLQSAGSFTLLPGAVNFITTGAVWARTSSGGPLASVKLLRLADDKAQILFDNCFKIVDGPDAPQLAVRELDKELIISLTNPNASNNYRELYQEKDPAVTTSVSYYKFEGYKVFQLKSPDVTTTDLKNPDKARLVFQCDIKNGVSQIINQYFEPDLNAFSPVEEVNGQDNGLRHTFRLTTDAFASGDPGLVNHKTYYFMAIAYAYNPEESTFDPYVEGLSIPYLAGRRGPTGGNIQVYTAIPHNPAPEEQGLVLNSYYGDGPEITRITGYGNGYNIGTDRGTLDLRQDMVDQILANGKVNFPTYQRAKGPVDIRIYDAVKVAGGNFELWLTDTVTTLNFTADIVNGSNTLVNVPNVTGLRPGQSLAWDTTGLPSNAFITQINGSGPYSIVMTQTVDNGSAPGETLAARLVTAQSRWVLKNMTTGVVDTSDKSLEGAYDQLFDKYGFYISMNQVKAPGEYPAGGNGFIEATKTYADPKNAWFGGLPDNDNIVQLDWIRSGSDDVKDTKNWDNTEFLDAPENFERMLGGTWAPFRLVSYAAPGTDTLLTPAPGYKTSTPPYDKFAQGMDSLAYLSNVDIVLTPDKSKWSRCVVFEMQRKTTDAEGRTPQHLIRRHPSLNQDGSYSPTDSGMSWFPGYAIDIETGERLNIAFGEDSYLKDGNGFTGETGWDMAFNPTSTVFGGPDTNFRVIAGGKHFIYVFGHKNINPGTPNPTDTSFWGPAYDGCQHIYSKLWPIRATSTSTSSLPNSQRIIIEQVWKDCMWVGLPMSIPSRAWLSNEVKVRLRVARPYRSFTNDPGANFNEYRPYYQFNTDALMSQVQQTKVAVEALDMINVVPNPYYAYSAYEQNQLDNRIKIVNLPPKCTVTIYTPNGTLVRKFKREELLDNTGGATVLEVNGETSLDWDMKNSEGVTVASGMYIIHIDAPGVGERTLKWFGVLRPLDLDTF